MCAHVFFFVDEGGGDGGDDAGGAVGFVKDFGCGREGEEGGVAGVDEGITQGAAEGGDEDFLTGL